MNRRRHANAVPLAGTAKWMIVFGFLGIAGLSYVHFRNQMHSSGNEIKALEQQLAELTTQNDVVRAKISQLSSRSYLQRRIADGSIRMTPITDDRIVRITAPRSPHAPEDELRAVSNRFLAQ